MQVSYGRRKLRKGAQVEAVELPVADSVRDEVSYAIGALENSRHKENANAYLAFLATAGAQDAYVKFGFVKARPDELALKPSIEHCGKDRAFN